ncbi:MAG: hypothetical protein JSR44_02535 [Spirochaetes bacterium]|nr:hypothetical protein [Spirochaetota bacterium]
MQNENAPRVTTTNMLDLEKYRLKQKLKDAGVEWREDKAGKFKMWIRLSTVTTANSTT